MGQHDVIYRLMEPSDLEQAVQLVANELDLETKTVTEELGTWFDHSQRAVYTVAVAMVDKHVVGTVSLVKPMMMGVSRAVVCLAVNPAYRGQGIGTGLIRFIENVAVTLNMKHEPEAWLVTSARPMSVNIFRKLGYEGQTIAPRQCVILTKKVK